jgi:hypothetical protein
MGLNNPTVAPSGAIHTVRIRRSNDNINVNSDMKSNVYYRRLVLTKSTSSTLDKFIENKLKPKNKDEKFKK